MIFEKASKLKLRFDSPKGKITTEDLWDIPLECLNRVAIDLNRQINESEHESFIAVKKDKNNAVLHLQMDVVKRVIDVRLQDLEKKEKRAANAEKKKQIMAILAEKEENTLKNKSAKALKEMLDSLDEDDED